MAAAENVSEVPLVDKTQPLRIGDRFENPWTTWQGLPGIWNILRWKCMTKERNTTQELEEQLPVHKPNWQPSPDDGIILTWLGHASVLVQIDGFTVLTDPILTHRCSPMPFSGHDRLRPPPCTFDELPKVNAVVISHNHYDHLDYTAISTLHRRFGDELRFYVPMGLKSWFNKSGISNVVELSWWESHHLPSQTIGQKIDAQPQPQPQQPPGAQNNNPNNNNNNNNGLEFVCVPAQHWSLRNGLDRNASLWGGWVLVGGTHRFYFAGDTGYCPEFKNIGKHYGPFHASAIPIGCYIPREFMHCQHIDPNEAVQIHQDIRSKYSLGIHWGTYDMGSLEAPLTPKTDLRQEVEKAGLDANSFFTLHHGQSWTLPADEPAPT